MASTHVSCLNISNYKVDTSPALDNWEGSVAKFLPNQTCGSIPCSGNKRASKGTFMRQLTVKLSLRYRLAAIANNKRIRLMLELGTKCYRSCQSVYCYNA